MKRFIRQWAFPILGLAALFFASCSLFEDDDTGSVIFRIDDSIAKRITKSVQNQSSSRAISPTDSNEIYFDIALKGEYQAKKNFLFTENTTVTFDNIPVGRKLYAEATAYSQNNDKAQNRTIYYSGKSEVIKIKRGENRLQLILKAAKFFSISITILTEKNDISLSYEADGTTFTFKAENTESSPCSWYVADNLQSEKSGEFTLETSEMTAGTYEIGLVCGDKSATAIITID